jgi:hypothetical protein
MEVVGDTIARRLSDGPADASADVKVVFDRERSNGLIRPRNSALR